MAHAIFNAKCTVKTVAPTIDPTEFNITADIYDAEGLFSGLDVVVNDVLILDTAGTEPGTVSKYIVKSITDQTYNDIEVTLKYDDMGDPIDPTGAIDIPGFICRPTATNGLLWVAANDTQGFAMKLVTYANNIINFSKIEYGTPKSGLFLNDTGSVINNYSAVYIKSDGSIDLCDADLAAKGECFGIVSGGNIPDGEQGVVTYVGPVVGALAGKGFASGDHVYVGETPGDLVNVAPSDSGDTVFLVGRVGGATSVDLFLEKKLIIIL